MGIKHVLETRNEAVAYGVLTKFRREERFLQAKDALNRAVDVVTGEPNALDSLERAVDYHIEVGDLNVDAATEIYTMVQLACTGERTSKRPHPKMGRIINPNMYLA